MRKALEMRVSHGVVLALFSCGTADAQTGSSFVTSDGVNRAPAVTLHCVGPGNVAAPCGSSGQPLYVAGSSALASSSNQSTQIQSEQAIAAAAGTPQDSAYSSGAGSTVAILKGLFAVLAGGINAGPASGALVSRTATLPAGQSTQLFPSNPTRHLLAFQAPAGSALWVNFLGGLAIPNGIDCVQLGAGTLYESGQYVTRSAVTVYTPVAASVSAWEG